MLSHVLLASLNSNKPIGLCKKDVYNHRDTVLEFISSTFPGQLYPMYAEKIARNRFHLSPEVPGARVEGETSRLA